jgi:hypothetical protein
MMIAREDTEGEYSTLSGKTFEGTERGALDRLIGSALCPSVV